MAPDYRSRLVAKEINTHKRPDLFAATPPLESIRYIMSYGARKAPRDSKFRIMVNDVSRVYFFAPARRELYIEIPMEDRQPGDEDRVAKLNLSMYDTRDAAQNWAFEYASVLRDMGGSYKERHPMPFLPPHQKPQDGGKRR